MLSKLQLIEPTFWPQRFPNVISNLISLLTLSISPFNNFPPSFDFETLYFIFTMLSWWQFDKIFSINWITLKVDLKKKMCQPKKIGLSLSKIIRCFLLLFSSICLDYIYMVKFPSWLWFSAFVIQSILFWGVERKNATVLGVDCSWILFYMMHFEPVSDILRVQTTGSILLKFQ